MSEVDHQQAPGLVLGFRFFTDQPTERILWKDIESVQDSAPKSHSFDWIHLDFTHPQARQWMLNESGLDPLMASTLLDEDSRPRTLEHRDGLFLALRGVNLNPGAKPEDMISIRCWIEKNRFISTRRRRLMSITNLRERIEEGWIPANPAELLVELASQLENRIGPAIDLIDDALDHCEEAHSAARTASMSTDFSNWRRRSAHIRRFLAPQREALERASRIDSGLLTRDQRLRFREQADHLTRHLEDLDLVRERAIVAQEEMLARLAHEQNSRIYVLSLVAAIFLPISFVTGLMGMNVGGLPGLEHDWAFWIVCAGLAGVAAGILLLFRLRKWM